MHLTATGLEFICRPTAHNRDCELYTCIMMKCFPRDSIQMTALQLKPTPVTVIHVQRIY